MHLDAEGLMGRWQPTGARTPRTSSMGGWLFFRLLEADFIGLDWRDVLLLQRFIHGLDVFERLGVVFFSLKNRLLPSKYCCIILHINPAGWTCLNGRSILTAGFFWGFRYGANTLHEKVGSAHGRLWNRQIDARISQKIDRIPMLGDLYQCLKVQSGKNSTTMFTVLSICAFCLREIRPESKWVERLKKTVDDYPGIPLQKMGFPSNWKSYALWK